MNPRAFALGLATGGRSTAGLAAVVLTARPGTLPEPLAGRWSRGLIAAAALGELVADKLPGVPSRLGPPALAGRLTLAAVAAMLATDDREGRARQVIPALAGALVLQRQSAECVASAFVVAEAGLVLASAAPV